MKKPFRLAIITAVFSLVLVVVGCGVVPVTDAPARPAPAPHLMTSTSTTRPATSPAKTPPATTPPATTPPATTIQLPTWPARDCLPLSDGTIVGFGGCGSTVVVGFDVDARDMGRFDAVAARGVRVAQLSSSRVELTLQPGDSVVPTPEGDWALQRHQGRILARFEGVLVTTRIEGRD